MRDFSLTNLPRFLSCCLHYKRMMPYFTDSMYYIAFDSNVHNCQLSTVILRVNCRFCDYFLIGLRYDDHPGSSSPPPSVFNVFYYIIVHKLSAHVYPLNFPNFYQFQMWVCFVDFRFLTRIFLLFQMIERALQELNEELGSSEDSILKFIKKEYNNLPWAHSTLLKHHLGKLCEYGDIVTHGQRYMLPGVIPRLNSSTGHKRKKRMKKWRLNWDWQRERYKPRMKRESKHKNQQNGDQCEISEDHKYLEATKPQQQEGDKADDSCPELSSQRPPDESIRIENSLHLGICSRDEFGAQECPIVMKNLHLLALRKLDSAEVTLKLTNKEQLMEHPVTQEPLIFGPLKDKSAGPTGLELVSTNEFCQSLRNQSPPEPKAAATNYA